jgi:hypothetical protein
MGSSRRLAVIAIAVVLTVVTYCAQSCFDIDAAKPVCPKHHTADCCKHETPVSSGTLQTMTSFVSGTAKFLPSAALDMVQEIASFIPATDANFPNPESVVSPDRPGTPVWSPVLRI